jgi:ABC-type molybdate transport system substrate-binding protein
MLVSRRALFAAAPVAAMAMVTVAAAETTDLALTCDAAAAPAVRKAAAAFTERSGVRVRVHPTSPALIVPQLSREIQNDILFSQIAILDAAQQAGLAEPGGRTAVWRNRLVVAAGGTGDVFAIPDATPASGINGAAVLRGMGLAPAKVQGMVNTGAVAWALANGQAGQGLLHSTEAAGLRVTATVPDSAWPPVLYAATVTRLSGRPNPGAFLVFLASPDGQAVLHAAGLEAA